MYVTHAIHPCPPQLTYLQHYLQPPASTSTTYFSYLHPLLVGLYKVNNDDAGSRDLTLVQSIGDTMGAIAISSCKGVLHDKACAMLNCKADLIRSILSAKMLAICTHLQKDPVVKLGTVSVIVLPADYCSN